MKHVTDGLDLDSMFQPPEDPPRTFGCPTCQDRAYVISNRKTNLGYQADHSSPCPDCLAGAYAEAGEKRLRQKKSAAGFVNRKLKAGERIRLLENTTDSDDEIPV